jgi:hypothetical protein
MRRFAYGIMASLCFVLPAAAQSTLATAQVNLQLREPIPADGGTAAAQTAVLSDAEKACAALSKALNLPCTINNIQFNTNGGPFGYMAANAGTLNANVNVILAQPNQGRQ